MTDPSAYCREIETYLCRKNGGHLIRIVGPAFEQVRGWAEQGIPLKVAFLGIDRTCERQAAKSGQRRPLRIEFCEADVLAAFDAWRRAIGGTDRVREVTPSPKEPLATHIERTVSRLVAVRVNGGAMGGQRLAAVLATTVAVLDELAPTARQARGDGRSSIITRLAELDAALIAAARESIDAAAADAIRREVEADLGPLAARMPPDVRERTAALAYDRLIRESLNLPVVAYE